MKNVIITSRPNVFYLTGLKSSFGFLVFTEKENFLVTDSRYFFQAQKYAEKTGFTPVIFDSDFADNFGNKFSGKFEIEDSVRFSSLEKFKKWFPNVQFEIKKSFVNELRRNKKEEEIKKIKIAAKRVDEIFILTMKKYLKLEVTEKTVVWELEKAVRDGGDFELSFDPIVAFGSNSAIPHHEASERSLKANENVLVDMGAKFQNYCSDITRNFFFGQPSVEYLNVFDKLKSAQAETSQQFKVDAKVKNLDQFCRKKLGELEKYFTHSLGHGVGIQIHEAPSVASQSDEILVKNEVVTCEPGIYLAGKFGIRIEDMILVRDEESEVLTKTEKNLVIVKT